MSYEIKRLESTICMLEDNLLRSRNQYEIERLQMDLYRLRRKLQTLKQRERVVKALSFIFERSENIRVYEIRNKNITYYEI